MADDNLKKKLARRPGRKDAGTSAMRSVAWAAIARHWPAVKV
jgi:hypothetical protein